MMNAWRAIRSILGCSKKEANARAEMELHRQAHAIQMEAVTMKVRALEQGAERLVDESRKAREAAGELMRRVREDIR